MGLGRKGLFVGLGVLHLFFGVYPAIAQNNPTADPRELGHVPFGMTFTSPKVTVPIERRESERGTIEVWQEYTLVQIENGEQLKEALEWAKGELAEVRLANPSAKVEVLVLKESAAQKLPQVFPGNHHTIEIGERVQWDRGLEIHELGTPKGKALKDFRDAEKVLSGLNVSGANGQIANQADAKAFVGIVPTSTRREDTVLAISRGLSTIGAVSFSIAFGNMSLVIPSILPAIAGGTIATFFSVKHIQLAEWVVEKGWLTRMALNRGIKLPLGEKPTAIIEFLLREYSLLTLFYGSIELASGVVGIRSNILGQIFSSQFLTGLLEFAKGPLLYSGMAMLSEGIASIALDQLTWELMKRNPQYRVEVAQLSKRMALFLDFSATLGMALSMFGSGMGVPILFALGGGGVLVFAGTYVEKAMGLMEKLIMAPIKRKHEKAVRKEERLAYSRIEAQLMGLSCGQLFAH